MPFLPPNQQRQSTSLQSTNKSFAFYTARIVLKKNSMT